jgi:predicted nucleic acid-binding protein
VLVFATIPASPFQNGLAAGKQIHDANIVAACLAYGIPRILTHNVADFKRFGAIIRVELI